MKKSIHQDHGPAVIGRTVVFDDSAVYAGPTMVLDRSRSTPPPIVARNEPMAYFGGMLATGLEEVVDLSVDPEAVEESGWWAIAATFEGVMRAYRFADVRPSALPMTAPGPADGESDRFRAEWVGPERCEWRSSLDRQEYLSGVRAIRGEIAAGNVYQVNLCRVLSAPLGESADPLALAARLAAGNPAPYQGILNTGTEWIISASPELFLSRTDRLVRSSPVKGTAPPGEAFLDKDYPENIMITDLVRNDLGRVAESGSVFVSELLARQEHPGVAHLVSTVRAVLRPELGWHQLLQACFPPGSVSGAPKIAALRVISSLENRRRGVYCGAVGVIDADHRKGVLAVGIRTFFTERTADLHTINFGTGAGITYSSDPEQEWLETELKASRLIGLASR